MRKLVATALVTMAVLARPTPVLAHARWFVDDSNLTNNPAFGFDWIYAAIIAGALLFIAAAFCIEGRCQRDVLVHRVAGQSYASNSGSDWRVLAAIFGLSLIFNSMSRIFIAPNIPAGNVRVCEALLFLQIIIGTMLVLQAHLILASASLVVLSIACMGIFSFSVMIDYAVELVGLGLAFYLVAPALSIGDQCLHRRIKRAMPLNFSVSVHTARSTLCLAWTPPSLATLSRLRLAGFAGQRAVLAVTLLRVSLGLQLAILAAHDKFLNPGVSLAFVDSHAFVNFMPRLGFEHFSNLHFVFAAGIAEVALALLLIGNIASRLASLILAGMFAVSSVVFGMTEAIGHAPILGVSLLIALHGSEQAQFHGLLANWRINTFATSRSHTPANPRFEPAE